MKVIAGDSFFKSWERMNNRFLNFIKYIRYDIPRGLKNLFIWAPIIWKDRNWDEHFLFKMMHKKLTYMEIAIKNGISVDGEKRSHDIKVCKILLDRLLKDDYNDNAFINHEKKWGELKMSFLPVEGNDHLRQLDIERKNAKTDKEKELERKESRFLYKHADMMRKQDVDLLFKIMSKKCLGWWD